LQQKVTTILGIETSCDDTSVAIVSGNKVLSNIIASQEVHRLYGGVVPELASRAHQKNIVPVMDAAIKQANVSMEAIDAIAFTRGPGLLGSLLVGTSFAKGIGLAIGKPLIAVNHMVGHVLAHFIDRPNADPPDFPFLCLTVSGGHTQLILVEDFLKMKVIGTTLDDAAGEAFDKSAKMLGFDYPGGPLIDRYAQHGNPSAFSFSKPNIPELNYSFSGLKTSIMYFLNSMQQKDNTFIATHRDDLCASIQSVIIEILLEKLKKAIQQYDVSSIAIAGGVSANSGLRSALKVFGEKHKKRIHIPLFEHCTDNAAMIAITGKYLFEKKEWCPPSISAAARIVNTDQNYLINL
jgi:N6-L-threonylcarbamoyladenine synthase